MVPVTDSKNYFAQDGPLFDALIISYTMMRANQKSCRQKSGLNQSEKSSELECISLVTYSDPLCWVNPGYIEHDNPKLIHSYAKKDEAN